MKTYKTPPPASVGPDGKPCPGKYEKFVGPFPARGREPPARDIQRLDFVPTWLQPVPNAMSKIAGGLLPLFVGLVATIAVPMLRANDNSWYDDYVSSLYEQSGWYGNGTGTPGVSDTYSFYDMNGNLVTISLTDDGGGGSSGGGGDSTSEPNGGSNNGGGLTTDVTTADGPITASEPSEVPTEVPVSVSVGGESTVPTDATEVPPTAPTVGGGGTYVSGGSEPGYQPTDVPTENMSDTTSSADTTSDASSDGSSPTEITDPTTETDPDCVWAPYETYGEWSWVKDADDHDKPWSPDDSTMQAGVPFEQSRVRVRDHTIGQYCLIHDPTHYRNLTTMPDFDTVHRTVLGSSTQHMDEHTKVEDPKAVHYQDGPDVADGPRL